MKKRLIFFRIIYIKKKIPLSIKIRKINKIANSFYYIYRKKIKIKVMKRILDYIKNLFKDLFNEPITKREYILFVLIALLIIRLITL